jgi:hypothetical protein
MTQPLDLPQNTVHPGEELQANAPTLEPTMAAMAEMTATCTRPSIDPQSGPLVGLPNIQSDHVRELAYCLGHGFLHVCVIGLGDAPGAFFNRVPIVAVAWAAYAWLHCNQGAPGGFQSATQAHRKWRGC